MRFFYLVSLLLFCAGLSKQALYGGVRVSVSDVGVNTVLSGIMPSVISNIKETTIPKMSGEDHTRVGKVHWTLKNIVLHKFDVKKYDVKFMNNSFIQVVFSEASAVVSSDWEYYFWTIWKNSDHGTDQVTFSQTTFEFQVEVKEANGKPVIRFIDIKISFGDVDIQLHGGASWFYDMFKGSIVDAVKSGASNTITSEMLKTVQPDVQKILDEISWGYQVNKVVGISNFLVNAPHVGSGLTHMLMDMQGQFFPMAAPGPAPFAPATPLPEQTDANQVQIYMSNYVFDTLGWSLFVAKEFNFVITDSDLPSDSPLRLNTTSFQGIIPPLYKAYPNKLMELQLTAQQWPITTISASGNLDVTFTLPVDVNVVLGSNQQATAFVIQTKIVANIDLAINGTLVVSTVTSLQIQLSVASSNIGPVDLTALQGLISLGASQYIIPTLNSYLKQNAVPIPIMKGVHLIHPTLKYFNNYILISANMEYSASQ